MQRPRLKFSTHADLIVVAQHCTQKVPSLKLIEGTLSRVIADNCSHGVCRVSNNDLSYVVPRFELRADLAKVTVAQHKRLACRS